MMINNKEKTAGVDMDKIQDIVKRMIGDHVKVALANQDNYDNDGNVIDDYVAADVAIAMNNDNWMNVDDLIDDVLKDNDIYQSAIRRVA